MTMAFSSSNNEEKRAKKVTPKIVLRGKKSFYFRPINQFRRLDTLTTFQSWLELKELVIDDNLDM